MEKALLKNQILIMESNLVLLRLKHYDSDLLQQLKEQIIYSKALLKGLGK